MGAIKLVKRATVTQDIKDVLNSATKSRLRKQEAEYKDMHPSYRTSWMKGNGIRIAKMKKSLTEAGTDFLTARLRMLPFTLFGVEEYNCATFIYGETEDIIAKEDRLNLGPYRIYIDVAGYIKGDTKEIHLVPQRDPLNGMRFWHHHGLGPRTQLSFSFSNSSYLLKLDHPLNCYPQTCWGTFGEFATSAYQEMDTSELFRTLHTYLSRHDRNSHLRPYNITAWNQSMELTFGRPL
jgi:hypothetical protein